MTEGDDIDRVAERFERGAYRVPFVKDIGLRLKYTLLSRV
jgi:hypothetical protein